MKPNEIFQHLFSYHTGDKQIIDQGYSRYKVHRLYSKTFYQKSMQYTAWCVSRLLHKTDEFLIIWLSALTGEGLMDIQTKQLLTRAAGPRLKWAMIHTDKVSGLCGRKLCVSLCYFSSIVDTSKRQFGHHYADKILKLIFLYEYFWF